MMNDQTQSAGVETLEGIVAVIIDYVLANNPTTYTAQTLPRNESLMELDVLDSAGVVELLVFIEDKWKIQISEQDFTKDRIGSLTKIASLVQEYVAAKR